MTLDHDNPAHGPRTLVPARVRGKQARWNLFTSPNPVGYLDLNSGSSLVLESAGLRDHAAGPAAQQCHVGEVHRLGNRGWGVAPVKTR